MQKELNPDLFGESGVAKTRVMDSASAGMQQVLHIYQKLLEMRNQVAKSIEQINHVVGQFNEFMRTSHHKFEKLQAAVASLEARDRQLELETDQKLSQLNHRVSERKTIDNKIQEMIDRHNTVLKSYEFRLSKLQQLIGDREEQIHASTALLNEAKAEIARLKRF